MTVNVTALYEAVARTLVTSYNLQPVVRTTLEDSGIRMGFDSYYLPFHYSPFQCVVTPVIAVPVEFLNQILVNA